MKNINQFNKFQSAITFGILLFAVIFFAYKTKFSPDISYVSNDSQAQWIVHPEKLWLGINKIYKNSFRTIRFTKELNLRESTKQPVIHIKAHKQAILFVDNIQVATTKPDNWKKETRVNLSEHLKVGKNNITIEVQAFYGKEMLYAFISGLPNHWATDSSWHSEVNGKPPVKAIIANDTQSDFNFNFQQAPLENLLSHALPIILVFLFSAVICVIAHYKLKPKHYSSLPKIALVILCLLWVSLFFKKTIYLSLLQGYDSEAHLEHTNYLLKNFELPWAHNGWEFYQPPLFYIISAITRIFGNAIIPPDYNIITIKLLPFVCGLGTVVAIYQLAKTRLIGSPIKAFLVVLFAGSLPMNIYISAYYTNEILASFLLNLVIIFSLKTFSEDQIKPALVLPLSIVMGFGLLTKLTAFPIYIIISGFISLKLFFQRNTSFGNSIKCLSIIFLIPAIISGWFYFRNYLNYGKFLVSHHKDFLFENQWSFWQYPGYHTLDYFLKFGEVFSKPFYAGIYSFWDGLYSTLWGDGFLGAFMDPIKSWNWNYMSITYLIAFPAMLILLFGFWKSLACAVRGEDINTRIQHSFLVYLVFVALFFLIYVNLLNASYATTKSFYCLFLLTPLSVFFAQGLEQIQSLLPPHRPLIPGIIFYGWFGTLIGVIWISFLG